MFDLDKIKNRIPFKELSAKFANDKQKIDWVAFNEYVAKLSYEEVPLDYTLSMQQLDKLMIRIMKENQKLAQKIEKLEIEVIRLKKNSLANRIKNQLRRFI